MKRILIIILFYAQIAAAQTYVSFLDVAMTNTLSNSVNFAEKTTVPFFLVEGMMVVEATVNHQKGNYIIDTGAPTLVLNEKPSTKTGARARGISDGLLTDEVTIQHFYWSGIQKKNLTAFKVDISHLERVSGRRLAGIIGYDILKEVALLVDYETKTVQLSPRRAKLNRTPLAIIPFTMQAHLPVIKVKIGKRKLKLALDTASESNILDQKMLKRLDQNWITSLRKGEIQGVDQQVKEVDVVEVSATEVKNLSFEKMAYLATDLAHLRKQSDLHIDGLLGYPFFKQAKISINYAEQRIYVWSRE
ncbi:MAG: pepsin/retropepsin-like aspartic protease family protein [Bacteroidota bacterium]